MFEGRKMEKKTLDKNWDSIFDTFSKKDGILISLVTSSLNQRFVIVG